MTALPSDAQASARAFAAIAESRRSIYGFLPTTIERERVAWAIRLATLAPNHYATRPWRFHVFMDDGRARLLAAYEAFAQETGQSAERMRAKLYPAPCTIIVSCVPNRTHPKVQLLEEQLAVGAAVENLMLALAAAGIGSIWTTGRLIDAPQVRDLIGLVEPDSSIIAIVTVGIADPQRPPPARAAPLGEASTQWYLGV
jgi:nitroreductase